MQQIEDPATVCFIKIKSAKKPAILISSFPVFLIELRKRENRKRVKHPCGNRLKTPPLFVS
jgi:hypothetical protein